MFYHTFTNAINNSSFIFDFMRKTTLMAMMAFSAMTAAAQTPGQIQTSAMSDVPFAASLEATGLVRGETRQSVVPPM